MAAGGTHLGYTHRVADETDDYKTLSERVAWQGVIFAVSEEELELPDGTVVSREVVRHPGAVGIVAVHEGDVILVEQYRQPVRQLLLEIPAGKLDADEGPEACARRELAEETGFVAGELIKLGEYYTTPGFSDERFHMFLASDPSPGPASPDGHEETHMRVHRVPFEEAFRDAAHGRIQDGKTLGGILMAHAYLERHGA